LYDLKEDPYELNNLARQKRFSKLKKRLLAELLAWRTKAESKESRVSGNRQIRVSGKKETRERRDLA